VKLRTKLLIWYSGIFFLSAAVLVVAMYSVIAHKTKRQFFRYFENEYEEAVGIITQNMGDPEAMRQDVELEVLGRKFFPLSYELYDESRGEDMLLVTTRQWKPLPPMPEPGELGDDPHVVRVQVGDDEEDLAYLRTGWVDQTAQPGLMLRVGMSYARTYERLEDLREYLAGALFVSMVLSLVGSVFLAGRSLDPVDEIASALERIQAESLSERLPEPGTMDEIGRIVVAANRMLSRLEQSFEQVRRFAGDAGHELKTPLAALRCRLEIALENQEVAGEPRQVMTDALEQVDRLTALANDLLLLARLDAADRPGRAAEVNLANVLADVGELFEVMALNKGVEFIVADSSDCVVRGDSGLLRRLLSNLLENAIRYTPPGGRVKATVSKEAKACCIVIADTGMGIEEGDLERVFERFHRCEESRRQYPEGSGLGLSMCRSIVELHGGTVACQSTKDEGTTMTVRLPVSPSSG